ncbi:MAG: D-alanine--D-alanine ligase family protein [Bacillota bacterium]
MKVCVLHRPFRNSEWQTRFTGQEFADDAIEESRHHAAAIAANGHETTILTWSEDIIENIKALRQGNFDLVVNASSLPEVALLELLDMKFMGSGSNLVALDKATRKRLWHESGVLTPQHSVVEKMEDLSQAELPDFPLFVKPVRGRGSAGITDESICETRGQVEKACQRILQTMDQGALVEEYIQGTEVTVGVIGNAPDLLVLPPLEIEYASGSRTNTFVHKQDNEIFHCPARLEPEVIAQLKAAAAAAFISVGARDYGRVDFIYDAQRGKAYALELNTFAGLQILSGEEEHLHQSYIGKMCETLEWDSAELFRRLLDATLTRYGLT